MARKNSRKYLTLGVIAVIGGLLTFAFWPRPLLVDIGEVMRSHLVVTIDEEGKTRVHDIYLVATPVAGRLLRVNVEPGDPVSGGISVVAEMLPDNPSVLDARSLSETHAEVKAAEATLQAARAERNKAIADKELADIHLLRMRTLWKTQVVSREELDLALREARVAEAAFEATRATIAVRQAQVDSTQARLISFNGREKKNPEAKEQRIALHAPVTGRVLRLLQESETPLPAGTPVVEIGNIDSDLEVVVELLSADAVQVSPGDRVMFRGWGGKESLEGIVQRIEPWGFTKVSALGVEEQRVNTIIAFTDSPDALKKLGHGFRVEAKIVVWEKQDALVVPSSALFRDGPDWAVYQEKDGTAHLRHVQIGMNNGIRAQVAGGLELHDRVILYPSAGLIDGAKVAGRKI